jgi:hypothetical protein
MFIHYCHFSLHTLPVMRHDEKVCILYLINAFLHSESFGTVSRKNGLPPAIMWPPAGCLGGRCQGFRPRRWQRGRRIPEAKQKLVEMSPLEFSLDCFAYL